ncbi:hypothetical protein TNCV_4076721 [Trichonephila clavipes]|nr:hypothetical protein TNCV_4076721 [Trichonephila clavipes]
MPLRRWRAQYHPLTTWKRDRFIEPHELGLSLLTVANLCGHNLVSIFIVPGTSSSFRYCSRMKLVPVCRGMMTVHGYSGDLNNKLAHFVERETGPTPGTMVWVGIMFDHKRRLIDTEGHLTVDRYITQVMERTCYSALVAARTQHGIPAKQCQEACRMVNS